MDRTRILAILFSAYFQFAILLNSVGTVILQSIATFGASKEGASVLEAFKDLPIAAVSFAVASFLPRLGYKRALLIGFAGVSCACLLMPLVPSFTTAKILFFTVGASFALVKISVYSTIGLLTESKSGHASLLNLIEGFFMIGVLAGYWIFAAFIDAENPSSQDWVRVYWFLALLGFANAGILAVSKFPTPPLAEGGVRLERDFAAMIALLWRPVVIVFVTSAFLYVLIEQGIGTWLPTFNNEVLHLPSTMSVQAASIFAAALAAGRLGAGVALRWVEWRRLLNICIALMAALVVLTLPATRGLQPQAEMTWLSAPFAAFIFPLIGLFLAPIYPAINSVVLSSLPRELHASMTGLIVVFSALGGTTGSLITGQTFARLGGETAFMLSLAPMAMLFVCLNLLRRMSHNAGSTEPVPF